MTRRTLIQMGAALAALQTGKRVSANDRIQIGYIGCGARAHELLAATLLHSQAEVTGVVDAYTGRVERAISRTKGRAKAYKDYRELLADPSIDAVFVVTPDHWHKQMIVEAARAGKDVYSEKPLTFRASEGNEIVAAAREHDRIVQVGSQGMSSPLQQKAREMVAAGQLGKVTIIRAAYNRNTASGAWIYPIPPDASPQTVNWDMFLGPAPRRPFSLERFFRWRCYEDYSGGIATDLFVHLCTTIHHVMGAKAPSKVTAMGQLYRWKESREVPDTMNAILEYPEGFVVNLSSTFNNQKSGEGTFEFLGTEGSLDIGWQQLTLYPEIVNEDNAWIVNSWSEKLERAYYADPKVREQELVRSRKPRLVKGTSVMRQQGLDATYVHIGHFLDSVRSRKPYLQDALAGHRAAACAHMVNLSAKENRQVEWDFDRDDIRA